MKYIYLLITCGLIFIYLIAFFKRRPLNYSSCFAFFLLCFAIRPFYDLVNNQFAYYTDHKKLVKTVFPKEIRSGVVYSEDVRTKEVNEYFLDFHTGDIHFKGIRKYSAGMGQQSPDTYFLINGAYRPTSEAYVDGLIKREPSSLKLVRNFGRVSLYRVENQSVLDSLKANLNQGLPSYY